MKKLLYYISTAFLATFLIAASSNVMGQSPSITVIQPNGGEQWAVGTTHLISWTDNITQPVLILLSTDGVAYSDTLTSAAYGTTWTWDIPLAQDTSDLCKIKIVSTLDNSVFDVSDAVFSVKSTLPEDSTNAIVQPNGGESWSAGTGHLISWTNYITGGVIQLSTDGGAHYSTITGADSVSGSTWTWDIPSSQTPSDSCLIKITFKNDTTVFDVSDTLFSISSSATGGAVTLIQPSDTATHWAKGTEHLISWTDYLAEAVKLELFHADTLYSLIDSSETGNSYGWTIPDTVLIDTNYKIRISSTVDTAIWDESDNSFSIDSTAIGGAITLIQPSDTAIHWAKSTDHLIYWTDNFAEAVKVELLHADTLYSLITSSVTGNSYAWTISDTILLDTNYKIKVSSTVVPTINDQSDNSFSIDSTVTGGILTLIQPSDDGIQWVRGSDHLISWTSNLAEAVKVELLNADTLYSILASSVTANSYAWTISDTVPLDTNYRIKVTSTVDTTISDNSDSTFSVVAFLPGGGITVIQPNDTGIQWTLNTTHLISWTDNLSEDVNIELVDTTNPSAPDTIATGVSGSTYAWTIYDSIFSVGSTYRIRVSSSAQAISDESDSAFSLVAYKPGGAITVIQPSDTGIQWTVGTTHLIAWTDNLAETVNIDLLDYTVPSAVDTTVIATGVSGSTYAWHISDTTTLGTKYRILVSSSAQAISDESDSTFSLVAYVPGGTITVIQPSDAGIQWTVGTTHLIAWTDNLAETVNIDLLDYTVPSAVDTTAIATGVSGSTYAWHISDTTTIGTKYRILVSSSAQSISDESDSTFSLVTYEPGGTITVIQPNIAGIQWTLNTTRLISWTDNLAETVNIDLLDYTIPSAVDTTSIATGVPGTTYAWHISDTTTIGTKYRILVSSSAQAISDESDSTFSLVAYEPGGTITVIQPSDSGMQWAVGTTRLISWTDNLTENVNIDLLDYTVPSAVDTTSIATGVPGTTYGWHISDTTSLGTKYRIRVSSGVQSISDESDSTFSLVAYEPGGFITVKQPNGGESWAVSTEHLISWTLNFAEVVKVELIHADTVYSILAPSVTGNSYSWMVSDTVLLDTNYRIKVTSTVDSTINDESDSTFSLVAYAPGGAITVVQPNGGEGWTKGSEHLISWTLNFAEPVKVELVAADTVYSILVPSLTGNSYSWTISDTVPLGTSYKIQVTSTVDSTIWDQSDTTFSITATPPGGIITLIQPNGGDSWPLGSAHLISWTANFADAVKVDLVAADTVYSILASSVVGNSYSWTISDTVTLGANYKVKVTSTVDTAVWDKSDNTFSIVAALKIATYPNPTSNFVTVRVDDKSNLTYVVTLYNRYGDRMLAGSLNTSFSKELRLSTLNIPNGIYFISVTGGPERIAKMIIVQH